MDFMGTLLFYFRNCLQTSCRKWESILSSSHALLSTSSELCVTSDGCAQTSTPQMVTRCFGKSGDIFFMLIRMQICSCLKATCWWFLYCSRYSNQTFSVQKISMWKKRFSVGVNFMNYIVSLKKLFEKCFSNVSYSPIVYLLRNMNVFFRAVRNVIFCNYYSTCFSFFTSY